MRRPIVLYLDTQDVSKFGDFIRGQDRAKVGEIFLELERLYKDQRIRVAYSAPLLSELFQYKAEYRETTFAKAEAIERLSGTYALSYPPRLVAIEIFYAARRLGLLNIRSSPSVLSHDQFWYPDLSGVFASARENSKEKIKFLLSLLPTRYERRRFKQESISRVVREVTKTVSVEYGFPEQQTSKLISALLSGDISAETAGHRFFSSIATPTSFCKLYFEQIEGDQSFPSWIRDMSRNIEKNFINLRSSMQRLNLSDKDKLRFKENFKSILDSESVGIVELASDDGSAFGVDENVKNEFKNNIEYCKMLQSYRIFREILRAYAENVLGFNGTPASVEKSFGGDLMHALYIPYVNLWRGDRRFAHIVKENLPEYRHKIVSRIEDLPGRIEAELSSSHAS